MVTSPLVSDSGPVTGAQFTLSATVRNDGNGAATATLLRYYRSADATITASDTQVATHAIAGIAPSGSASESVELTAPATPGAYYYGACVDAVTDETDTTNNCSTSAQVTVRVTVTVPLGDPDLVVTSASSDSGRGAVHAVGNGDERWQWRRRGDDAALLLIGRRDDHDIRHAGGHGGDHGACRYRERLLPDRWEVVMASGDTAAAGSRFIVRVEPGKQRRAASDSSARSLYAPGRSAARSRLARPGTGRHQDGDRHGCGRERRRGRRREIQRLQYFLRRRHRHQEGGRRPGDHG